MSESMSPPPGPFTRAANAWSQFWFTPKDPTVLGLMRLLTGMVTFYTFVVHGLTLPQFMGENAWFDLKSRTEIIADRPMTTAGSLLYSPLAASESAPAAYANDQQKAWAQAYKEAFDVFPPSPHPESEEQFRYAFKFRQAHGFDFRFYGLPFPKDMWQQECLDTYTKAYQHAFPPPYPANKEEVRQIDQYLNTHGVDPRRLYDRGTPLFSVWLHVTDPFWMNVVHWSFTAVVVCFMVGLGTRVATPIVWFANICYIHRNQSILFGVDTMMNVLLLYLMIGPSGAAVSVDRLIARWWTGKDSPPEPSVSAGITYRLLQIHLCIIYLIAGVSKLQGLSWWQGNAVWAVLANYEFAPMNLPAYNRALRWLGQNQLVFESFLTGACLLTIVFELSYAFLIWRKSTRWLLLIGAVFLHGFIGLFMGLKTFSLLMLVFNMAFLRPEEVTWLWGGSKKTQPTPKPRYAESRA